MKCCPQVWITLWNMLDTGHIKVWTGRWTMTIHHPRPCDQHRTPDTESSPLFPGSPSLFPRGLQATEVRATFGSDHR